MIRKVIKKKMHRKKIVKTWILTAAAVCCLALSGCSKTQDLLLETGSGQEQEALPSEEEETKEPLQPAVPETKESELYIYICGEVKKPGVYVMEPGDRIYQLIEKAGGLTDKAQAGSVNQAELLEDGAMIYVPAKGEETPQSGAAGAEGIQDGKVDLNTATEEELMSLNGIGEGKAKSIIAYREAHGKFSSIEEIMNVEGIKEGTYNKIKDSITV